MSWFVEVKSCTNGGKKKFIKQFFNFNFIFMHNHRQGHVRREGELVSLSLSMHPLTFPIVVLSPTLAHTTETTRKLTRRWRCLEDYPTMVHKQHKTNFVTWGLFFSLYFLLFIYFCLSS